MMLFGPGVKNITAANAAKAKSSGWDTDILGDQTQQTFNALGVSRRMIASGTPLWTARSKVIQPSLAYKDSLRGVKRNNSSKPSRATSSAALIESADAIPLPR